VIFALCAERKELLLRDIGAKRKVISALSAERKELLLRDIGAERRAKSAPSAERNLLRAQSRKNFVFAVALLPHKELIKKPIKCKHLIGFLINSSLALLISYIVCTKMGVISTISGIYTFILILKNLNSM